MERVRIKYILQSQWEIPGMDHPASIAQLRVQLQCLHQAHRLREAEANRYVLAYSNI